MQNIPSDALGVAFSYSLATLDEACELIAHGDDTLSTAVACADDFWSFILDPSESRLTPNAIPALIWRLRVNPRSPIPIRDKFDDAAIKQLVEESAELPVVDIRVNGAYRVSASGLTLLVASFKHLQTLALTSCASVDDTLVATIAEHLDGLKALNLRGATKLTDEATFRISTCPAKDSLRELNLAGCGKMTGESVEAVASIPNLRRLNMGHWLINDADTKPLASLQYLEELEMVSCKRITSDGMTFLSGLKWLNHLNIGSCYSLERPAAAMVASLPKLLKLEMPFVEDFGEDGMADLALLQPTLRSLNIYSATLTNRCIMALGKLTLLQELCLGPARTVTDAGMVQLKGLRNLEVFALFSVTGITDDGLAWLEGCTRMRSLSLDSCETLTSKTAVRIAAMRQLETLDLADCIGMGDDAIAIVTTLPNLTKLTVNPSLTDESVPALLACESMGKLDVSRNSRMTPSGIDRLRSSDNYQIHW